MSDWLLDRMEGRNQQKTEMIPVNTQTAIQNQMQTQNQVQGPQNVPGMSMTITTDFPGVQTPSNPTPGFNDTFFGDLDENYETFDKYEMKQKVSLKLNEMMRDEKGEPSENYLRTIIAQILNSYPIPEKMKQSITTEIIWDLKGYGIIQPFLDDDAVTEIICCSYDNIWVEKNGRLIHTDVQFGSEKELRLLIDKIVQPLGRRIDDMQPYVNGRLKDKSRVNAVIDPIAAEGATLDIRKFARQVFTMKDYVDKGSMTQEMTDFIKYITLTRKNVIVSGGTGSGKTTLLNCISRFIPEHEAIVTIEDLLELQLVQPCVRRLEARGANAEGTGAVTIRDLVVNSLRMRPDRIIVGECRSSEIVEMIQAMNTGHDGSFSTVHANNSKDAVARMATMYLMAGMDIPEKAIKSQIASAVNVIIQAKRMEDGSRKIIQISEIVGFGKDGAEEINQYVESRGLDSKFKIKNADNNTVYIQDIYKYDEINKRFMATGWIPTFFDEMVARGCPVTLEMFEQRVLN